MFKAMFRFQRRRSSILFKFGMLFCVFILVNLLVCGVFTYMFQDRVFLARQVKQLRYISEYLSVMIHSRGNDFAIYQKYFLKNCKDMQIPKNFTHDDMLKSQEEYERLFAANHAGKILGETIQFEELTPEVQMAFAIARHEYYVLIFEEACRIFDLKYVYYIVPDFDKLEACYMLDAVREGRSEEEPDLLLTGEIVEQVMERHKFLWEAWNTGKTPTNYDVFNNEYGHTYAWYSPLFMNDEKLGLICTEIAVSSYNHAIFMNTIQQLTIIAIILTIAVVTLLYVINRFYIKRIKLLSQDIFRYSFSKDAKLAGIIEKRMHGRDEISELGNQTASMIMELENYMKSLVEITNQLLETKEQVNAMSALAKKDALTGVGNRNAYEQEIKRIDWQIADGKACFGIVMIDLNYLKRINDTYGHEHGNFALKKCCSLICETFENSPVFRIGGDEFVVLLENDSCDNVQNCIDKFNRNIESQTHDKKLQVWERVSAAIGYAKFDPRQDESVYNVFKRADKAMYARKVAMKATRNY